MFQSSIYVHMVIFFIYGITFMPCVLVIYINIYPLLDVVPSLTRQHTQSPHESDKSSSSHPQFDVSLSDGAESASTKSIYLVLN